jgi:hypothetical protein
MNETQRERAALVAKLRAAEQALTKANSRIEKLRETLSHLARSDYDCDSVNICEAAMFAENAIKVDDAVSKEPPDEQI